ncbi:MAG: hypothetical protein ACYC65_11965 [Candidatus Limnocylindrales bacterium]
MTPLLLALAGLAALVAGWLLMRRLGTGARIGRILAATPVVPLARAIELAGRGSPRYVAVGGRIGSAEEFEDEAGRPLVFRRTRLELRRGSAWTAVEDRREVVPFDVAGGLETMAVDADALGEGLVVVTRESEGTAGEIPDRVPPGTDPATPVRLRVEHVSSIDHALVLGVPSVDPERGPMLRPGLGRPLVLTTLEPAEAMRLLAAGRRGATIAISVLLAGGLVTLVGGLLWAVVGGVA